MRIAIDLQGCQTPGSAKRGIGRYSLDLATALIRNRGPHEISLLFNEAFQLPSDVKADLARAGDHEEHTFRLLPMTNVAGVKRRNRQHVNDRILDWRYAAAGADVLHISSIFEGWNYGNAHVPMQISRRSAAISSATLYDLIPHLFPEHYLPGQDEAMYRSRLALFGRLDLLLAISECSRRDAMEHLGIPGERIVAIGAAASPAFRPMAVEADESRSTLLRHGIKGSFILYTGGIDYRKNFDFLLNAYAQLSPELRSGFQLVMVCALSEPQKANLLRRAAGLGLAGRLVLTGYVSDEDLNTFYNACELFVFPSLYEGFGLPVLEAMSCGACVIASNVSSMPEILGVPEVLFDPHDAGALAGLMTELLVDPERRRSMGAANLLRSREFSWNRVATTAIEAMERAVARAGITSSRTVALGGATKAC